MRKLSNLIALFAALWSAACSPPSAPSGETSTPGSTPPTPSLGTFVAPVGEDYYLEPSGAGALRICRSLENSDRSAISIPSGTNFTDVGVIDQPLGQGGGWWLLQVQTIEEVELSTNQDCTSASARVVPTEIPANYSHMRALTRFSVSDRRYFEILANGDELDRRPAMLLLNARAETDFAGAR